jgi:hypothetical protein
MEIQNLDMLLMISSMCYAGLFMIAYLVILITSRKVLPRININFAFFLLFLIGRATRDTLYYYAYLKNPNINEYDTALEQTAKCISTIFSRAKWIMLYYYVGLAEDERINI